MLKTSVKKLIAFLLFVLIIWEVFIHCTYLFRNTDRVARQNVVGFYAEEENSLDVVFVGASCIYRYWDVMKAWNDYGIASYNYSVSAMAAGSTISAIKEIQKTQNPQLIVFDVRKLLKRYYDEDIQMPFRNAVDSMDYNLNRLQAVEYYRKLNGLSVEDTVSSYIDLIEYHNNYAALSNPVNWKLWDNRTEESLDKEDFYKGFAIASKHMYIVDVADRISDERRDLHSSAKQAYEDILLYCKENDINLLVVASPYKVKKNDIRQYNTMADIAEEYGFPFLDGNRYYEEMNLDFATDFYDSGHVNILGAQKYTAFLGKYIKDNYEIPDRRADASYIEWNEIYEDYQVDVEKAIAQTGQIIEEKEMILQYGDEIAQCEDAYQWIDKVENPHFTVLMMINEPIGTALDERGKFLLKEIGITQDIVINSPYIGVYHNGLKFSSTTDEEYLSEIEGTSAEYALIRGEKPQILVRKSDFYDESRKGIHMVVFDNSNLRVFDAVTIEVLEDGSLALHREK